MSEEFNGGRGNRNQGFRRGRARPGQETTFDYKDPDALKFYLTEAGRIVPRRVSRLNAKQQRALAVAVKRARTLALLASQ
jgi:small subunit ribosomal protein S18